MNEILEKDGRQVRVLTGACLTHDGYGGHMAGCPELLKGKGGCGCTKAPATETVDTAATLEKSKAALKDLDDLSGRITKLEKARRERELKDHVLLGDLTGTSAPRPHDLRDMDMGLHIIRQAEQPARYNLGDIESIDPKALTGAYDTRVIDVDEWVKDVSNTPSSGKRVKLG